jgi:hypothetical protein
VLDFILATHHRASLTPNDALSSINDSPIPSISYQSYYDLLTYGCPINVTIIHAFLTILRSSFPHIHYLDTNFSTALSQCGWEFAYHKYFLHQNSSRYAKSTHTKPLINSPTILIPIYISSSHWVALVHQIINNITYFLFSDDLNTPNTFNIVHLLIANKTSSQYVHLDQMLFIYLPPPLK